MGDPGEATMRGVNAKRPAGRLSETEAVKLERWISRASVRRVAAACGVTIPALDGIRWSGAWAAVAVDKVRAKLADSEVAIG